MPRASAALGRDIALCCIFRAAGQSQSASLPLPPFVCLFEDRDTFRPVVAVVVDLDVLPGLVARVAAELVVIGPHSARVVVVASGWRFRASYG